MVRALDARSRMEDPTAFTTSSLMIRSFARGGRRMQDVPGDVLDALSSQGTLPLYAVVHIGSNDLKNNSVIWIRIAVERLVSRVDIHFRAARKPASVFRGVMFSGVFPHLWYAGMNSQKAGKNKRRSLNKKLVAMSRSTSNFYVEPPFSIPDDALYNNPERDYVHLNNEGSALLLLSWAVKLKKIEAKWGKLSSPVV